MMSQNGAPWFIWELGRFWSELHQIKGVHKSVACPFFDEFKSRNVELFLLKYSPPCLIPHSSRSNHELKNARRVSLTISSKFVMIALLSLSRVVQGKSVSFSFR
jgi:hypothetical protein